MLKREKFVARPALHSFISSTIEEMFVIWDVKGAEIEASACDKDKPISACLRAPQSLAPSPHMETVFPVCWYTRTILALSLGFVLAKTVVHSRNYCCSSDMSYILPEKSLLKAFPVTQSWLLFSLAFFTIILMYSSELWLY